MKRIPLLMLFSLAALATIPRPTVAQTLAESVHVYGGANGAWLNGPGAAFPADFEAGGSVSASLSPHISLVGSSFYGFSHSYTRWDGGARVTATDVDNPNFNVYLGIRYRGGTTSAMLPEEWAPDAGVGWKPSPARWPNLILGADAGYGLQSSRTVAYLAVRYLIPLK